MLNYIDLFSGAGGFSYGLNKAGFKNIMSVEFDEKIAKTYKANFPKHNLLITDIKKITDEELYKFKAKIKEIDLIVGGPPCQGFSLAGKIGRTFVEDPRNQLFKEYTRFIRILKPKMFVFENVAGIVRHRCGKTKEEIINAFEKENYNIQFEGIINASKYGVPQERRRFFLIGSRNDLKINYKFPEETKKIVTTYDAIHDLPPLKSGESSEIPNHIAMKHREEMLEKMKYVKDGGDRNDIPEEIRPKTGDIRKYIRYDSKKPSVCVTGDMRKIFHYEQNRALTCRELARLQTFSDEFIFIGNSMCIQQQIGNAVPPLLAKQIGLSIKEALKFSI